MVANECLRDTKKYKVNKNRKYSYKQFYQENKIYIEDKIRFLESNILEIKYTQWPTNIVENN